MKYRNITDIPELEEYARNYKNGIQLLPHIIPVSCNINQEQTGPVNYQMAILLDDVKDGFLLTGIHSRYEIADIRIVKGHQIYFSAPGWFVYAYHDHKLEPPLFIPPKDAGWFLHAYYIRKYDAASFNTRMLEFALIGQKVVPL